MSERVRDAYVTIVVDTNKDTLKARIEWGDDEDLYEFVQRVQAKIRALVAEGNGE